MRHLRVHGNPENWSTKLVEEYDIDDKHHKQAISNLIHDLTELAVKRDFIMASRSCAATKAAKCSMSPCKFSPLVSISLIISSCVIPYPLLCP